MAVTFNTYSGLKSAVPAWLARVGDTLLDANFDNFLANCERRMYYGYATDDMPNPLRSDPLRIPEMETVNTAFVVAASAPATGSVRIVEMESIRVVESATDAAFMPPATIAQPVGFLELISVYRNTGTAGPVQIVAERVIDGYRGSSAGGVKLIAVSGNNFRFWDAPAATDNFTLRYFQKLATPTASGANTILASYPDVYLYGCLVEACIMTQDAPSAQAYLAVYNASVAGLNARRQRITASANPVMRMRGGMTP